MAEIEHPKNFTRWLTGLLHALARTAERSVVRFLVPVLYRIKVRNATNVPRTGPVLLLSNHVAWIDPLLLNASARRQIRFVIVEKFYVKPFVNFFCRLEESIPIRKNNPRSAIETAIEKLNQGEIVCVFPEGGITQDGGIRPLHRGFELIAKNTDCIVIPVMISNLYGTALAIRREWRRSDIRTAPWPRVSVEFGEPIPNASVSAPLIETWFKEKLNDSQKDTRGR